MFFFQICRYDHSDYIDTIRSICASVDASLLIPVHDDEVARLANSIGAEINAIHPSPQLISLFADKLLATETVSSLSVDIPELITEDLYEGQVILRKRHGVGSKGIRFFKSGQAAKNYLRNDYSKEDYLVQESLEGDEFTVDVASSIHGVPFAIIPRRRVEVKAGVATKVRIEYEPVLIDTVRAILYEYPIPGFCNVQFIKRDGKFYFIFLY